jgi:hypothetical protein
MKVTDIKLFINKYLYNIKYDFKEYHPIIDGNPSTFNYEIIIKRKIYLVIEFNKYSNYIDIVRPKYSTMSVRIDKNFKYTFVDLIKQQYPLLHKKTRINKIKNILI